MNSLMNYGSDDDSGDSGDNKFPEMPGRQNVLASKNFRKPSAHEDNYEEVGMDMSEDSDDSTEKTSKSREETRSSTNQKSDRSNNYSAGRRSEQPPASVQYPSYPKPSDHRSGSKSPKDKKEDKEVDRRSDRYRGGDRYKRRDDRSSKDSRDGDRRSRDRSSRDDDRGRDRDRYRDDKKDRRYSRDRRDRDRRRSRSKDRRRSRSPRRTSRSPRRSRSASKEKGPKVFLSRKEKADKRINRLGKLGIQFQPDNYPASALEEAEQNLNAKGNNGNRFFMPGITGRFREQIEKRKQLWQKSKEQESPAPSTSVGIAAACSGSKATKVYEATAFSDDKTSNKFKRLMGIKETDSEALPVKTTDVLKKQQEMFSSMEAQYEVARTATHTMRGVGLGFGSFQR